MTTKHWKRSHGFTSAASSASLLEDTSAQQYQQKGCRYGKCTYHSSSCIVSLPACVLVASRSRQRRFCCSTGKRSIWTQIFPWDFVPSLIEVVSTFNPKADLVTISCFPHGAQLYFVSFNWGTRSKHWWGKWKISTQWCSKQGVLAAHDQIWLVAARAPGC